MANGNASNVERLQKEGILETEKLTDAHKEQINKLTEAEIAALISIKQKLDFFTWPIRPFMF